ncbi:MULTISPECIES: NAD(P)/FAD-dependent oxidoreductase [Lysinibacillus]|uniref:NAD(P)/FAD-dependent oxidoreductase n=1 Tax=Lysinibacillus fusiformis TaxID=28031 RepID=A0A2I0V1W7_9BACI|nr:MULTISPECIES: NAD(P)/FAD-dependent oxidoreductase [Lysinibacillus]PKU52212.1 NAD(P)/FAD-dependent oxidoreductase [Lysinibacillus fusiformis]SCZ05677.1 Predicted flavoprotein CzcO associated with the cation diffusion facilitator CzcD [Lysinibacillus sp. SG9]SDB49992.1 Predicted flavoprotein CzcO associated with the cation diffusion facilitator CzcD [Lysinibacillus sp. TC-37]SFT09695.1 Predicted flavoprotein CzcO associated with the cation diffusion facilitator CzcD [Lysinibacillus sp. SG55]
MSSQTIKEVDAVVLGAGFAGLYMLHQLRSKGFSTIVCEAGDGVGGVWYWNRYPGARCDIESIYYNYTFSKELYEEWTWTSRFPEQAEILRYLNYVADRFQLRTDIQFNTRVTAAHFNEERHKWIVYLNDGQHILAKYFITGIGCLSAANVPNIQGLQQFSGNWYHTGHWPHEKVDFTGKRVGIIGTGSSGIQAIPVIAKEAEQLTVFQRTPQYTIPARNHPYDENFIKETKQNFEALKQSMRNSVSGTPFAQNQQSAMEDSDDKRMAVFEEAWAQGGFAFASTYDDLLTNEQSNEKAAEFIRSKIRQIVKDPVVAEKLCPKYMYGTKRQVLDSDYFEAYNRENVVLVDVKESPIKKITETGIQTTDEHYDLDSIIFATGYDGMTGPLFKIDIRGRSGETLKEKWEDGASVQTYLGLTTAGFPNLFMITGPESPSVLVNMPIAIEQHVEWIAQCIDYLREHDIDLVEPNKEAEEAWSKHCREIANTTLYVKGDSWYTGANIEGKPRSFLIYLGGFDYYTKHCHEVAQNNYEGFKLMRLKSIS